MVAILATTFCLKAQPPKKALPKSFITYGWSGLGFLDISNIVSYNKYKNYDSTTYQKPYGNLVVSYYTLSFSWRKSILEFNDHLSLSLETNPFLQFNGFKKGSGFAFLTFEAPLMLGINWGTAATNRSVDFSGGGFSAGLSFFKSPLLLVNGNRDRFNQYDIMFCSSFKLRRWRVNRVDEGVGKEIELFASIGQGYAYSSSEPIRPFHAGLIFRTMLNY